MSQISTALSRSEKQGAVARAECRGPPLTVTIDEACRKTGLGVTTLYALLKVKKNPRHESRPQASHFLAIASGAAGAERRGRRGLMRAGGANNRCMPPKRCCPGCASLMGCRRERTSTDCRSSDVLVARARHQGARRVEHQAAAFRAQRPAGDRSRQSVAAIAA